MTVATLRPDGIWENNTGIVAVSAANIYAALADDSDSSYADFPGGVSQPYISLALTTSAVPATALVKHCVISLRQAIRPGAYWKVSLSKAGAYDFVGDIEPVLSGSSAIARIYSPPLTETISQAVIDDLRLIVVCSTDGDGNLFEAYVDVVYVAQPVTAVSAPTGTVTNTNRPTVTWANTLDSDGGAQSHYEAKVFSAAQYGIGGFNPSTSPATDVSGIVASSATSRQVDAILADGTYRAYVRVAQTVNGVQHWSDWDYEAFTIDVLLPAVPTLTLTPQASSGRVKIDLADNAGDATTDGFDLERSVDELTWVPVRTTTDETGRILGTDVTVYDYEAPNGTLTYYRARAVHDYSGAYAASEWTAAAATLWESAQWWIKHPNVPALNLPVTLFSYSEVNRAARQTAHHPLGARLPVVVSDTRGGETGTIVVQCYSRTERELLDELLDTTATLLLQGPVDDGHPDRYVRFGDLGSARVVDKAFVHITREALGWVLVAVPVGAQTGEQYVAPVDDGEELVVA